MTDQTQTVEEAPPRATLDEEAQRLMVELDDLQTWATLLMTRQVPKAREAWDLIQRTRCFIVERALRPAPAELQEQGS